MVFRSKNMVNNLKDKPTEEKTPRQLLKETLDKASKRHKELPEWAQKAISTDLIFNVRKSNG